MQLLDAAGEYKPAAQLVHAELGTALYAPAPQAKQIDEEAGAYVAGRQAVQLDDPVTGW